MNTFFNNLNRTTDIRSGIDRTDGQVLLILSGIFGKTDNIMFPIEKNLEVYEYGIKEKVKQIIEYITCDEDGLGIEMEIGLENQLYKYITKRLIYVIEMAKHKFEYGVEPKQIGRWLDVLELACLEALELGIDPETVNKIWNYIHKIAIELENEVIADCKKKRRTK